ncbi:hypothetical protein FN846DRAFT_886136 [Sphaerosporella brunnea]|uniref:Uncharacterized protein n=1 Tax=Sphaerosporella brunnea TaxID=1250544 RepID=A0A5J5FB28_9PEZI|nr:hypothetical protein FN846DRAFT_886136 [Sphaerosporella brunnea]
MGDSTINEHLENPWATRTRKLTHVQQQTAANSYAQHQDLAADDLGSQIFWRNKERILLKGLRAMHEAANNLNHQIGSTGCINRAPSGGTVEDAKHPAVTAHEYDDAIEASGETLSGKRERPIQQPIPKYKRMNLSVLDTLHVPVGIRIFTK